MNKKLLLAPFIGWMVSNVAFAGTYEWTKGFAMGTTEYLVDDNNGVSLVISCPMADGVTSAYAHVQDKDYDSNQIDSGGFYLIIDGEHFKNPFFTGCRVCDDIFKNRFWPALRKANRLQLSVEGRIINLPVKNLSKVIKPYNHPDNPCGSAWEVQ